MLRGGIVYFQYNIVIDQTSLAVCIVSKAQLSNPLSPLSSQCLMRHELGLHNIYKYIIGFMFWFYKQFSKYIYNYVDIFFSCCQTEKVIKKISYQELSFFLYLVYNLIIFTHSYDQERPIKTLLSRDSNQAFLTRAIKTTSTNLVSTTSKSSVVNIQFVVN